MSSRKAYVRENFAAVMRKQEGSAIRNTPVTPRHIAPSSESASGPSHPAFDRLEEMKVKELQGVGIRRAALHFEPWINSSSGLRDSQEGVCKTP